MSFIERCSLFGVSFIGGSTVVADLLYGVVSVAEYPTDCLELYVATAAALCDQVHHLPPTVDQLQGSSEYQMSVRGDVERSDFWYEVKVESSPFQLQGLPGDL